MTGKYLDHFNNLYWKRIGCMGLYAYTLRYIYTYIHTHIHTHTHTHTHMLHQQVLKDLPFSLVTFQLHNVQSDNTQDCQCCPLRRSADTVPFHIKMSRDLLRRLSWSPRMQIFFSDQISPKYNNKCGKFVPTWIVSFTALTSMKHTNNQLRYMDRCGKLVTWLTRVFFI